MDLRAMHQEPEAEQEFREVLHPSGLKMLVPVQKVVPVPEARAHDALTTCRYASKRCANPRATKRNGELHSFCEMHRSKANQNQRRLESKKRLQREGGSSPASPEGAVDLHSSSGSEPSSPRYETPFDSFSSSTKLDAIHYFPQDDGVQYPLEALEPIPVHHDQHAAWLEAQYYQYQQQQQQQHFQQPHLMNATPAHIEPAYSNGYASRPPYTVNNQQPMQLMEWELAGDLVGSSVAFAQTLTL